MDEKNKIPTNKMTKPKTMALSKTYVILIFTLYIFGVSVAILILT